MRGGGHRLVVIAAMEVHGTHDERFASVADALGGNDELGAAVCVIADGATVVDIWTGWADAGRTRRWTPDTVVDVFSAAKPVIALLVLRTGVALETRVADLWPGFTAEATVHHLLAHRGGLPAVARPLSGYDWEPICAALAEQEPWWEPGTAHGYHVNTYGFLLGEVARRVTGRTPSDLLREALGDAELWYGAPRDWPVADFEFTRETTEGGGREFSPMQMAAYFNPPGVSGLGTVNTPAFRAAVIPSTNAHATARGLAGFYAALGELLDPGLLALATSEHVKGHDVVLERDQRFGLGFQLPLPERPIGRGPRAYGHYGVGGALAFADPDAGLAFAYTPNRGGPRWQNPRARALVDAVYDALR